MPNLNKQKIRRFYVSADTISRPISIGENDRWTHDTVEQAIDHAKKILAHDPNKPCVAVVEITHIITRQDLPVKVLKLKK